MYTLQNAGLSIKRDLVASSDLLEPRASHPQSARSRKKKIRVKTLARLPGLAGGTRAVPDNHLTGSLCVLTSSSNSTAAVAPSAALTRNAVCGPRQSHKPPINSEAGNTVMPKARLYKP